MGTSDEVETASSVNVENVLLGLSVAFHAWEVEKVVGWTGKVEAFVEAVAEVNAAVVGVVVWAWEHGDPHAESHLYSLLSKRPTSSADDLAR